VAGHRAGVARGLALSRANGVEHSCLGRSPTGRFYPVHDWPVFRCPPRVVMAQVHNKKVRGLYFEAHAVIDETCRCSSSKRRR
jgi:hypothetical protein